MKKIIFTNYFLLFISVFIGNSTNSISSETPDYQGYGSVFDSEYAETIKKDGQVSTYYKQTSCTIGVCCDGHPINPCKLRAKEKWRVIRVFNWDEDYEDQSQSSSEQQSDSKNTENTLQYWQEEVDSLSDDLGEYYSNQQLNTIINTNNNGETTGYQALENALLEADGDE